MSNYWKTKLENAKTAKEFWAVVKTMQGKKKHTKIGPIKDEHNNIITDDFGRTESFNNFFTSVGSKLASNIIP